MLKRLFCKHDFLFTRNIHGEEIFSSNYKRSIWTCHKCGKRKYKNELYHDVGVDFYE